MKSTLPSTLRIALSLLPKRSGAGTTSTTSTALKPSLRSLSTKQRLKLLLLGDFGAIGRSERSQASKRDSRYITSSFEIPYDPRTEISYQGSPTTLGALTRSKNTDSTTTPTKSASE